MDEKIGSEDDDDIIRNGAVKENGTFCGGGKCRGYESGEDGS